MPGASVHSMEPATSAVELLNRLREAGGRLKVDDPIKSERAVWRRAIYALINGPELPEGKCIRHSGRDRGGLVIQLVNIDADSPPASKPEPIPVPDSLRKCHPIVRATLETAKQQRGTIDTRHLTGLVHLRIHKSHIGRALLIVQGLVNEAERRGYGIGTHKSHGCVGGLGLIINGHGFEITVKEEQRQVDHVLSAEDRRRRDRGEYVYGPRYDYEWTGRLQLRRDTTLTLLRWRPTAFGGDWRIGSRNRCKD